MLRPGLRTAVLATVSLVVSVGGLALPASADDLAPGTSGTSDETVRFVADDWPAPPPTPVTLSRATTTALATYAPSEAFTLHSRPGAQRTIYLDFDGGSLLSTNFWLANGLSTLLFPGWSTDGSAAFSDAERSVVIEVWARMAEDFAPFDVDVTTDEPAAGGLFRSSSGDTSYGTRVAFTSGAAVQSSLCGGCGGLAWVGTFDSVTNGEVRSPAWVFPSSLGNKAKNLAEAGSHEAGHTLGLSHDGSTSSGYYSGTSLWGPLMGSPYSSSITQWSKGEYPNASNHEDDLAVVRANGLALRPDEAGDSVATALPFSQLRSSAGGRAVITSPDDEDWYSLTDCSGTVTVGAVPTDIGPNLDIGLEVRGPTGALLESSTPTTVRTYSGVTGLGANISLPLSGGPFHVTVSGIGSGTSWSGSGYDDYGSLGTYRLSVTGCTGADDPPPTDQPPVVPPVVVPPSGTSVTRPGAPGAPRVVAGARGGRRTVVVRWAAPARTGGTPVTGYRVLAYRVGPSGRYVGGTLAPRATRVLARSTHRIALALPRGRWVIKVRARNRLGWSAASRASRPVVPR